MLSTSRCRRSWGRDPKKYTFSGPSSRNAESEEASFNYPALLHWWLPVVSFDEKWTWGGILDKRMGWETVEIWIGRRYEHSASISENHSSLIRLCDNCRSPTTRNVDIGFWLIPFGLWLNKTPRTPSISPLVRTFDVFSPPGYTYISLSSPKYYFLLSIVAFSSSLCWIAQTSIVLTATRYSIKRS